MVGRQQGTVTRKLFFDQFEDHHLSRITGARAELHHPGISAIPVGETWGDLIENTLKDLVVPQFGDDQSPGGNFFSIASIRAVACDRDNMFRFAADCRSFRLGRSNPFMSEELLDQVVR